MGLMGRELSGGHADDDGVGRYVTDHRGSGADDGTFADRDAGDDPSPDAEERSVADGDPAGDGDAGSDVCKCTD